MYSFKEKFPFFNQYDGIDCAPTCLRMVAKFYGRDYPLEYMREIAYLGRNGVSLLDLADGAEKIGFKTLKVQIDYTQLIENCPLPCILHWNQNHYVVLYQKEEVRRLEGGKIVKKTYFRVADPAHKLVRIEESEFKKSWISNNNKGIALVLIPTEKFYQEEVPVERQVHSAQFLWKYLKPYKRYISQLLLGMVMGSMIALLFPFLTQLLIDKGVGMKKMQIVEMVLLAQLMLFVGDVAIDVVRNWLLLHINTRVSVAIISDFLGKLMQLHINFFDIRSVGDITQRVNDHHRIENFLTGVALTSLFSFINIIVYTFVLSFYSLKILLVFLTISVASVLWIFFFLKKRKALDYVRFQVLTENQDHLLELIQGMSEIKLNNSELTKRWEWERIQLKLFKLNMQTLLLEHYQRIGFLAFTQFKNILISYIAANEVINGNITLGMLLSISYIVGQTNSPLQQLIAFFRSAQDTKISLERLQEVHNKENEEVATQETYGKTAGDILLQNVSFQYGGKNTKFILKDINLVIPQGKITAIVGASGSGKTTLLKLLLNFYAPTYGEIKVGDSHLQAISPKEWRNMCGTVMQDGFIFSDSIARNIALNGENIQKQALLKSAYIANLEEFVNKLPLGFNTKIGKNGNGLSGGQKQRILIARAIYKEPEYIFFDEATSALDSQNEKIIMENLNDFFQGKTVVIIAHRLSTVKNADQIIVLDEGKIIETGSHNTLTQQRGYYFSLVKNQLELGD